MISKIQEWFTSPVNLVSSGITLPVIQSVSATSWNGLVWGLLLLVELCTNYIGPWF